MKGTRQLLDAMPPKARDRLLALSREVTFPAGTRIFSEGSHADRFWVIQNGRVELDVHVPGRKAPVVESLVPGNLVGWSWLFPPYTWQLGATAATEVHALEFDAAAVRALCDEDPVLGQALARGVAEVVGHRLRAARVRLLDLYGPYGSGNTLPLP
ncbi:cyclic nucleotide-binding domain-containing protein [Streptomyces violascens]|uniref:cyclic nucleotide-binding domain-containing protein n=1 Tax=Streptomyces violascens TaxID=67381 RepID=UPI00378B05B3